MANHCKTSTVLLNVTLQYLLGGNLIIIEIHHTFFLKFIFKEKKKKEKKKFNAIINYPLKLQFCVNLLDNGGNKTAGARTSSQEKQNDPVLE